MKAIIPAAGLGTRFLPLTNAVPKELLPLMNKPALQYVIEEALASNIEHFGIIINKRKQAIANYLQSESPELRHLKKATYSYINQAQPLGLGHAILKAEQYVQKEPFAILLPDDIILGHLPELKNLIDVAQKENATVVAVLEVKQSDLPNYGVIKVGKKLEEGIFQVEDIVEKPAIAKAPSNFAIVGRYVVFPPLMDALKAIAPSAQGEIQLSDALSYLVQKTHHRVLAYKIQGERHDVGTPCGWLKATLDTALRNPSFSPDILTFIQEKIHDLNY